MLAPAPPAHPGIKVGYVNLTDTSLTSVLAAPGLGFAWMITLIVIGNKNATSGTTVKVFSGSTQLTGGIPTGNGGGQKGAGAHIEMPLHTPLPCNDNEAVKVQTDDAVNSIDVTIWAYKATAGTTAG